MFGNQEFERRYIDQWNNLDGSYLMYLTESISRKWTHFKILRINKQLILIKFLLIFTF